MELSEYQKNNIDVIVFKRPYTMLQQYEQATNTKKKWLLFLDEDAELISIPNINKISNEIELVSFKWINSPLVFGNPKYTTSNCLVRTSALKDIIWKERLSSVGLDLYLQHYLKVQYHPDGVIRHNTQINMKKFYRYGKGRGYYVKTDECDMIPKVSKLYVRYSHLYLAYIIGYIVGVIKPRVDEKW